VFALIKLAARGPIRSRNWIAGRCEAKQSRDIHVPEKKELR
jgi:hypothetical protein